MKMSVTIHLHSADGTHRTVQRTSAAAFLQEFNDAATHRVTWLPQAISGFFDWDTPWTPMKHTPVYVQDPSISDACWHSSVLKLVANGQQTLLLSEQAGRRRLADLDGASMREYRVYHLSQFNPVPPLLNAVGDPVAPPDVTRWYSAAQRLTAPPYVNAPPKWCSERQSGGDVVVIVKTTPIAAAVDHKQVPLAFVDIDAGTYPLYQRLFGADVAKLMQAHRRIRGNDYVLVVSVDGELHVNSVPPREFQLIVV